MSKLLFFLSLSCSSLVLADPWGYEHSWPGQLQSYFDLVNTAPLSPEPAACAAPYRRLLTDGVLNINYALGYFDESDSNELASNPANVSISLDITGFNVIRNFLTTPCDSSSRQKLCGFSEVSSATNGGKVSLMKRETVLEQTVEINFHLTRASATDRYHVNLNSEQPLQRILTAQSEENFFSALGDAEADIIFYNGHSRNGGGPDFSPPVLRQSDLHPDYSGYYQVRRTGMSKMFDALEAGENKNQIVGLFSCYSQKHFSRGLSQVNPRLKTILTSGTVPYDKIIFNSLAYLEGILQSQCGASLRNLARQDWLSQRAMVDNLQ